MSITKKADMWTGDPEVEAEIAAKELAWARKDPQAYVNRLTGTMRATWPEVKSALRALNQEGYVCEDQEKQAAKMVKKPKIVEETTMHCPHCDFEFREKCYPQRINFTGEFKDAYDSGEYDDACPECGGIIDEDDADDETIEKRWTNGWFDADSSKQFIEKDKQRRDVKRRRRAERETTKSAADSSMNDRESEQTHSNMVAKFLLKAGAKDKQPEPEKKPSRATIVELLRRAKERSDAGDYPGKNALVRRAMSEGLGEFHRDSRQGRFAGVTHEPSGFRIHVPNDTAAGLPMAKGAAKWDKLLRAGKLSAERMLRNGRVATDYTSGIKNWLRNVGATEPYGKQTLAIGPSQIASPDMNRAQDALRAVRAKLAESPNGSMLPAHLAVSAPDRSVAHRLAALHGVPVDNYKYLPTASDLQASMGRFDAPARRLPRLGDPSVHPSGADNFNRTSWAHNVDDAKSQIGARYNAAENMVYAKPATPVSRHELGHFAQFDMARHAPARLNTRLASDFSRLRASAPEVAHNMLQPKRLPTGQMVRPAGPVEFQAHALAARGTGVNASRIRSATSVGMPTEGSGALVGQYFEGVGSHAANRSAPHIRSATEHLTRNYGVRPNVFSDSMGRTMSSAPRGYTPAWGHYVKSASVLAALRRAMNETHQHPTPAQAASGNYKKGRFSFQGLQIAIENPTDSIRRGTDKNGKKWETRMRCPYGYFTTPGKAAPKGPDNDPIDVFVGPDLKSDVVVVIDQTIDGKFDEHKIVVGCSSEKEAVALYLSNYDKGWKVGPTTVTDVSGLKSWLNSSDTRKPFNKSTYTVQYKAANELRDTVMPVVGVDAAVQLGNAAYGPLAARLSKIRSEGEASMLERLTRALTDGGGKLNIEGPRNGAHVNVDSKTVTLGRNMWNPGILAHEMGHLKHPSWMLKKPLVYATRLGAPAGLYGAMMTDNENTSLGIAGAGSALSAGLLGTELDASRRGFSMLRGMGSGRLAAAKAFVGVPTYAAATVSPLIAHFLRKHLGAFDGNERSKATTK